MQLKRTSVFMVLIITFFMSSFVQAARPTVKMTASPATIIVGGSSTLTWNSSGATRASINNGIGTVPVNGSVAVTPSKTTSYTITVRNSSGSATSKAMVKVNAAPPTVTFVASPDSILAGQSSTLSWTTANATTVSINNGIGTVARNGSRTVTPPATTTYTITVKGGGGTVTATATVTVTTAPPPIASLTADPVSIYRGQSSTLTWTSENATSVSINNGVGSVDLNGSVVVSPTLTTIYTLTATGLGGTMTDGAQVQVSVYPAPAAMLTANPQAIQPGENATLSWTTANADSVTLDNGIGAVEANGSLTVSPSATTTYTLTATGFGGTKTVTTIVIVSSGRKCYAFIPDSTDKTVRIVDTDTNILFKTITVNGTGTSLQGVAAEESGVYVYVADAGLTSLLRIDPLTMTISDTLTLDGNFQGKPRHVAVAQDGCHVYTTSSVPFWDPDLGKYVGDVCSIKTSGDGISSIRLVEVELPGRATLEGLAVSIDGSRLFVADPDNGRILVLDTAKLHRWYANPIMMSDELVATIPVSLPKELAVSPDGQKLYATSSGYLHEIDAAQFTVSRSLAFSGAQFLKVSPDGSRVYLMAGNALTTVETAGLTKLSTVAVTGMGSCSGFDVHPDGARLFMVDGYGKKLFMVNAADSQVISTLGLGSAPVAVGRFIGLLPVTVTGNVRQDGNPLSGVTMTLNGEGILRTRLTPAAGDFIFALKPGNYSLTPTLSNLAFAPEKMDLQVSQNQTGLNFTVSGVVPPPTVSLVASKTWILPNEKFTLTWNSTGADYVTLELLTSEHLPPSGSRDFYLQYTSTVIAKAFSRGGTASASVMIVVSYGNPPTAAISAAPASILQGGSSTLTWNVTGASTVTIDNGIGAVAASGSKVVSPAATTTYTVTGTRSDGYQVMASTSVTVSEFDMSAKLIGIVTDFSTNQPLNEVLVSASDASGVPQDALTDVIGKYTISNLRVGSINVSFSKMGYNSYQQIISIPSNTTFDLTTQLHQTLIGATLRGLVKDGQTNLPIVGATVIAAYSGFSQTSISAADGSYVLTSIPLGISATITASYTGYQSKTIQQTFTQAQVYVWDFVIYDASVLATVNGKITNAKTLEPEEGVSITYKATNATVTSNSDGEFIIENIPLGEQSFLIEKVDFVNKIYKLNVDRSIYQWDLVEPYVVGVPYPAFVKPNVVGTVYDVMSGRTIPNAKITTPGLNINVETDQNGSYSFNELPEGNYPFLVMALNHKAVSYNLAVSSIGKDRFDFYIPATASGSILGIVSDAQTGQTINSATIEIEGSTVLVANSDSEGKYKIIQIPSGSFVVKANHGEYEEASFPNISVSDNQSTNLNVILTKKHTVGKLEGTLKDDSTGNPISGAILTIEGTSITATTDDNGFYQMADVPAGLNTIIINATSYPQGTRTIGILANPDLATPEINILNIQLDLTNPTPEDIVSITINAPEGGEIATEDDRFILTIPPNSLSADAIITLKFPLDGPLAPPGSDLSIDPEFGISDIKSIGKVIQLEIAPVVAGNPLPSIKGGVLVSGMYSKNEVENYNIEEKTIAPYYFNGSSWGILRTIPNELIVDNVNNLVVTSLDLTETESGNNVNDLGKYIFVFGGHAHSTSGSQAFSTLQIEENPNTNIKIIDKENLSAVTQFFESSPQYPNPNALPVLFFHGWQFKATALNCTADPNNQDDRYYWMINDVVKFTNGVYRPVFISYNPRARIESLGNDIAQKIFPGLHSEIFTGIPATNSDNPDNGFFPFFDAIGYSMGGIVARSFNSRGGKINNMEMIATPNHGTLSFIKYVKYLGLLKHKVFKVITSLYSFLKFHSPGSFDLLGYDDSDKPASSFNPSLATLNVNPNTIPWGDMTLLAGTDHSKLIGFLLDGENDSLVPVDSVFCRTSDSNDGEKESLLKVLPGKHKWEREAGFNHFNVCSPEAGYRIANFQDFIRKGLSDWTVSMSAGGNENNYFLPPTETTSGSFKTKVFVDYNVLFDPENSDSERHTPRDIDRTVLVSYAAYVDGDETKYYIVGNNVDQQGNVLVSVPVQRYSGFDIGGDPQISLSDYSLFPQIDPNNAKTRIIRVFPVICNLSPGENTVPLTPKNVTFSVPDTK